jgi:RNA polymerase sigma-70 factor (ECF subfamily)
VPVDRADTEAARNWAAARFRGPPVSVRANDERVAMDQTESDVLGRARGGDGEAFRQLTEPYRHELQVHCYRMLGSFQDAEDATQETLLAAWRGLGGFEARSSVRTWLYRIATNRCLNARRAAGRRPAKEWDVPGVELPEPSRLGGIPWLEPFPDALLESAGDIAAGPEARYEQAESISLAFVTALQVLPPRQVAVLVLRDVLGFRAQEVADMLETTVDSVTSAVKRARSGLRDAPRLQHPIGAADEEVAARFASAYEASDLDALLALLTDDVFVSMPPMPFEYEGRQAAARFFAPLLSSGRQFELVPTRANGQPAFGAYVCAPDSVRHGTGLFVVGLRGSRISALTRFESSVLSWFGLPRSFAK